MIESWVGASGNLLPPLLKEKGHTYTFLTRKPTHYQNSMSTEKHPVFRYAKEIIRVETNDVNAILDAVRGMHFDGVITVCDYYIEIAVEVTKALNIPCPFSKRVKNIREKHLLRKVIDEAGLPNIKYSLSKNWDELLKAAKLALEYQALRTCRELLTSRLQKAIDFIQSLLHHQVQKVLWEEIKSRLPWYLRRCSKWRVTLLVESYFGYSGRRE